MARARRSTYQPRIRILAEGDQLLVILDRVILVRLVGTVIRPVVRVAVRLVRTVVRAVISAVR
jgi:hypothetical protein